MPRLSIKAKLSLVISILVLAFIAFLQGRFGSTWWEQLPKGG